MSKGEAKMELHEKTAASEALLITDEERRWCDLALSALPAEQAKRFNEIPLDVRETEQKFLFVWPMPAAAARCPACRQRAPARHCSEMCRGSPLHDGQVLCVVRGFAWEKDRETATKEVCTRRLCRHRPFFALGV